MATAHSSYINLSYGTTNTGGQVQLVRDEEGQLLGHPIYPNLPNNRERRRLLRNSRSWLVSSSQVLGLVVALLLGQKDYEIVSPECGELRILRYNSGRHDSTSMIFGRQMLPLLRPKSSTSFGFVGVHISNDMRWDAHIAHATGKANRTLGVIRRNLSHCTSQVKNTCYKALVRPQLENCASVWDPCTAGGVQAVEHVQRRAARMVMNDYGCTSS
ncbi:hypothetical protein Bbelb_054310 [Branchiostoma belcheri]|nr:hypothetical protein Bbelb_054310 [Branchiostoma belcheri]